MKTVYAGIQQTMKVTTMIEMMNMDLLSFCTRMDNLDLSAAKMRSFGEEQIWHMLALFDFGIFALHFRHLEGSSLPL